MGCGMGVWLPVPDFFSQKVGNYVTDTSELWTPLYNGHLPKSGLNPRSFCTLEPPEQRTPLYSVQRTLSTSRVTRKRKAG